MGLVFVAMLSCPMPRTNPHTTRPPDRMSIIATSSATRSGLSWMGSTLPRKTILPCLVREASTDPITFTDGIMHSGLL